MSSSTASAVTPTDELARRHPVPPGNFTFEPSERHVRGVIGDFDLVDSYAPVLVWEPGQAVPGYVFPRADIRADLLTAAATAPSHGRHPSVRQWYDVAVNGVVYPTVVFQYEVAGLEEYLAVDWFRREEPGVEHW
jgi:uncharacterized protein (DUF427 family)